MYKSELPSRLVCMIDLLYSQVSFETLQSLKFRTRTCTNAKAVPTRRVSLTINSTVLRLLLPSFVNGDAISRRPTTCHAERISATPVPLASFFPRFQPENAKFTDWHGCCFNN